MNEIRTILAALLLGASIGVFHCYANGPNTDLPYAEDFESYPDLTPLINGIGGWYADSDRAIVQTDTVFEGTNAAMIPIDVNLKNQFQDIPATNVWIQLYLAPVLYGSDEEPELNPDSVAMLFVNSNGLFTVQDTVDPQITNWVTITHAITGEEAVPVSNQWVRLDLYQDYAEKKWTLFSDFILLKEDINFINVARDSFEGFDLYNGSGGTSFLDNVAVTISNPADLGLHGGNWLPTLNVDETSLSRTIPQGQDALPQTFQIRKTGGYYALDYTNTVTYDELGFADWISLDIDSGTSTGENHTVTVSYSTSELTARSEPYWATIRVDAKDSRFGFEAFGSGAEIRVSIRVVANAALEVDPTFLSQTVDKGSNPTNQSFLVWNSSEPPRCRMDFTLEEDIDWLSLSAYSGMSTGNQQLIGVMFEDMSGFNTGTNSGAITIKATADTGEGSGITTQEASVVVEVIIIGPPAPVDVSASDGTDTEAVIVTWTDAPHVFRYEVWRGDAFDLDYAGKIAEVTTTNYVDRTPLPGALYYYWVKSVSEYGVIGDPSEPDTGYRGLPTPGGVFASAGTFTNKVRVTWSPATGAESYELYRAVDGQGVTNMFHTRGLSYDDLQVKSAEKYSYRVKAKNSRYSSGLSEDAVGFILAPPTGLSASEGTLARKVSLAWSPAESATAYEIWRSEVNLRDRASLLARVGTTEHTDSTVEPGKTYFYWLKSRNASATSGFSEPTSGYGASGSVDISASRLVLLPDAIAMNGHPSVVSFRVANDGTIPIESPNTAVGISFYASTVPSLRQDSILLGQTARDLVLAPGQASTVIMNASELTMPAEAGDYYIFVHIEPVYPSTLIDANPENNTAMRAAPVRIDSVGKPPLRAMNDYDGDGISDLALVSDGNWFIRSVDGATIASNVPWGGPGFISVVGDYDGDGVADLAAYASGMWFVRNIAGDIILWADAWGADGLQPVFGAFNSSDQTATDLAVYGVYSGGWYIRSAEGEVLLWEAYFGQAGYIPVPGDYDGDGIWDIAVYHESTGAWYIRTVAGELLLWGEPWGGPGFEPVTGDFDGDGVSDLAVYCEILGLWFIQTMSGDILTYGQAWGGPGFVPVSGDFTGNGASDLAVYNEAAGKWYIVSAQGELILWDSPWGGPGYKPVGR